MTDMAEVAKGAVERSAEPSVAGEPATPNPPVPAKGDDLKATRDAVVDAAGVSAGIWLSYLFVLFYLLVAVGGVTHRDLFLESPLRLPFLSVDLPLKGFFRLGPLLFLVVHAYVLLHFVLLANKVGVFDAQLRLQIDDPDVRAQWRRQLPSNIFVQFLAGPAEVRRGLIGFLLQLIAWISLVVGPIALLAFFHLQFLPYHDEATTWWQRIAVVLDLALLWMLWPAIVGGQAVTLVRRTMGWGTATAMACVSLVSVPLVFGVATFPGEWWEGVLPSFPLRRMLVAGEIDEKTRRPESLWSNRLVLPGFDAVDHTKFDRAVKIAAASVMVSFRTRRLERAVLTDATLPRADFTGAHLEGASLTRARLQGAWFDHAVLSGAQLDDAQLQGASFYLARLQGASLNSAQLQGAPLAGAQLQGAWLAGAQLQGASLAGADLRRASLENADLRGANLYQARLQGVSLAGARLQGASLRGAFVWRADFRDAKADAPGIRIEASETGPKTPPCEGSPKDACDPAETLDSLRRIVELYLPEGAARGQVLNRLKQNLDPAEPLHGEEEIRRSWVDLMAPPSAPDVGTEESLAELWREIACAAGGAPFVLTGLVDSMGDPVAFRFKPDSEQVPKLAGALLADGCAAKPAMTEVIGMQLVELKGRLRSRVGQPITQAAGH